MPGRVGALAALAADVDAGATARGVIACRHCRYVRIDGRGRGTWSRTVHGPLLVGTAAVHPETGRAKSRQCSGFAFRAGDGSPAHRTGYPGSDQFWVASLYSPLVSQDSRTAARSGVRGATAKAAAMAHRHNHQRNRPNAETSAGVRMSSVSSRVVMDAPRQGLSGTHTTQRERYCSEPVMSARLDQREPAILKLGKRAHPNSRVLVGLIDHNRR